MTSLHNRTEESGQLGAGDPALVAVPEGTSMPVRGAEGRDLVKGRFRAVRMATLVADGAAVVLGLLAAWQLREALVPVLGDDRSPFPLGIVGLIVTALWLGALAAQGAYTIRSFSHGMEDYRAIGRATFVVVATIALSGYLLHLPVPRAFALLSLGLGTLLLLTERYAVRKAVQSMRVRGLLSRHVVVIGGPAATRDIIGALGRHQYLGYDVVGICLPQGVPLEPDAFAAPVIGRAEHVRWICDALGADTVLVTRGGDAGAEELRRIAWDLEGSDIDLIVAPSLTDVAGPRIDVRPVAGLPLLHVTEPQAGRALGWAKRLFDIAVASSALVLLTPLLLLVALAVKLQDGGPVLFWQARVGRSGKSFDMIKFRSMSVDAEDRLADLMDLNESDGGMLFKIQRDPRITRVGGILRRLSLDEMPQLWNVVRGEMSIVGPRPPLPEEVARYEQDVRRRLLVRPGITGLWQVSGRSDLDWDESVRLDLFYVDNWSMTADLVIIAKTVRAVLRSSGAY